MYIGLEGGSVTLQAGDSNQEAAKYCEFPTEAVCSKEKPVEDKVVGCTWVPKGRGEESSEGEGEKH